MVLSFPLVFFGIRSTCENAGDEAIAFGEAPFVRTQRRHLLVANENFDWRQASRGIRTLVRYFEHRSRPPARLRYPR